MDAEAAKLIGAGLAMMGMIGAGVGVGNIFASFISAVGRNPSAAGAVQGTLFIGMALVEAIALFALVIALLILFL
jgi:F-type H+-transporting ATPase subunit c